MLSEHPVLAEHTPLQVAAYLREIGDTKTADAITKIGSAGGQGITLPLKTYPWMCANHVIGYVAPGGKSGRLSISPAVEIEPDADLIGKAIKINLNKFHVNDYPGILKHTVLMEFTGRSQTGDTKEDLRFTTVCEIKNKDSTSAGLPIFTGVRVPADGLAFDGRTVRVKGDGDEMILGVLKSKTFQRGITLLAHAQPALPMLTQMSAGVVEYLLKQSRNRAVQRFDLGLDFSRSGTSAQLRLGSYIVAQVPDDGMWNWSEWQYDQHAMSIVRERNGKTDALDVNYMIFGVSPSSDEKPKSAERGGRKSSEAKPRKGGKK